MVNLRNFYTTETPTRATLTADLTIAASVAGVMVDDSSVLSVGINFFVSDGVDFGYFEVTAINSATSIDVDFISGSPLSSIIGLGSDIIVTGASGGGGGSAYLVENLSGSVPTNTGSATNIIALGQAIDFTSASDKLLAIGTEVTVSGTGYSTAIGHNVQATSGYAVAIGYATYANGEISTAIGGATSDGYASFAAGSGADATAAYSVAIGYNSSVTAGNSEGIGIGYSAVVDAAGAIQLGQGLNNVSQTLKFRATTVANSTSIQAATSAGAPVSTPVDGTIVVDNTNDEFYFRSSGAWQTISGGSAYVIDNYDGAVPTIGTGSDNYVVGEGSAALGTSNTNVIIGSTNTVGNTNNTNFAVAIGRLCDVEDGNASVALGFNCSVNTTSGSGIAIGSGCEANAINAIAIGTNALATNSSAVQISTGTNNTPQTIRFFDGLIADELGIVARTDTGAPDIDRDGHLYVRDSSQSPLLYYRSGGSNFEIYPELPTDVETFSATLNISFSPYFSKEVILTGNITQLDASSMFVNGAEYVIWLIQDGVGGHTVAYGSSIVGATALAGTGANAINMLIGRVRSGTLYIHTQVNF